MNLICEDAILNYVLALLKEKYLASTLPDADDYFLPSAEDYNLLYRACEIAATRTFELKKQLYFNLLNAFYLLTEAQVENQFSQVCQHFHRLCPQDCLAIAQLLKEQAAAQEDLSSSNTLRLN